MRCISTELALELFLFNKISPPIISENDSVSNLRTRSKLGIIFRDLKVEIRESKRISQHIILSYVYFYPDYTVTVQQQIETAHRH